MRMGRGHCNNMLIERVVVARDSNRVASGDRSEIPRQDVVLASTTSYLPIGKMAAASYRPDGMLVMFFFFFQAEDGIRDKLVTGVQTCALPICYLTAQELAACMGLDADTVEDHRRYLKGLGLLRKQGRGWAPSLPPDCVPTQDHRRSEERRVGKECRSRWSPYH